MTVLVIAEFGVTKEFIRASPPEYGKSGALPPFGKGRRGGIL